MQSYDQAQGPPQNTYPRFDDGQQQSGFAVAHNNPYSQGQPVQPMYVPPTQYGMPVQPGFPGQIDDAVEGQIRQIDHDLDSGCWACFNCWMYVVAIFSALSTIIGILIISVYLPGVVMVGQAIVGVAYAVTMINVLKYKNLDKAVLGVNLAYADGALMIISLTLQRLYIMPHIDYYQYFGTTPGIGTFAFYVCIWGLLVIMPAMKIKEHVQRRESLISKSTHSFNA